MRNLCESKYCDEYIEEELHVCRIQKVHVMATSTGEVRASVVGRLGPLLFNRAGVYWVVRGPVPADMAAELYADPLGRRDIRVDGHCGCPPPRSGETVMLYHIDSEAGLRVFADAAHRRGLGVAL